VRALGGLLALGLPPTVALLLWHREVPTPLCPELETVARRLRLGASVPRALDALSSTMGGDAARLAALLLVHDELGGDVARSVRGLASSLDRRADLLRASSAAAAGARLSGRVIAALPLLLLPAVPLARAPLLDAVGAALLSSGVTLALAGILVIERFVPPPPGEDGAALVAETAAGVLRAGIGIAAALDAVCVHAPADVAAPLARARRLTRLGASWSDALQRTGDERLHALGGVTRRVECHGLPSAGALETYADGRRAASLRAHETALRRAPVLMVVPLTIFVLPSFFLLGVAPFLRALPLHA
jgi:tight adherence protein B